MMKNATFADDEERRVHAGRQLYGLFCRRSLFKDEQRSCLAAVARVIVLLVALERGPYSSNTGAYCRARGKLSEKVIRQITINVGDGL